MRSLPVRVVEGPRSDILRCVEEFPGIHLRRIERETRLPLGQVLYHLDRLERMGVLVSARDAGFRRYFPSREVGRGEKRFLGALRQEAPRRILLHLLERGQLSHKDLQAAVGTAASTLSFHLARLVASGVVRREPRGAMNLYEVTKPALVRRELIYYRESFRDREVDRFVREMLDRLVAPQPEPQTPPQSQPSPLSEPPPLSS